MSFEEFKNGRYGGHLGYLNGTILAILNLCVTVMLPIKFWLNPTFGLGGDGNNTILAILSLYNYAKPPIKFLLNLTYCLGLGVV